MMFWFWCAWFGLLLFALGADFGFVGLDDCFSWVVCGLGLFRVVWFADLLGS